MRVYVEKIIKATLVQNNNSYLQDSIVTKGLNVYLLSENTVARYLPVLI